MAVKDCIQLVAITNVEIIDVSIFVAFAPALHAAGAIGHFLILIIE